MLDSYEEVLKVEDVMDVLRIGKNKAYALLKSGTIPSQKVGKLYVIPKDGVINFLTKISKSA